MHPFVRSSPAPLSPYGGVGGSFPLSGPLHGHSSADTAALPVLASAPMADSGQGRAPSDGFDPAPGALSADLVSADAATACLPTLEGPAPVPAPPPQTHLSREPASDDRGSVRRFGYVSRDRLEAGLRSERGTDNLLRRQCRTEKTPPVV